MNLAEQGDWGKACALALVLTCLTFIILKVESLIYEFIDGDYTRSKKLAYDEFIPYLVKMVQKQQKEINELKELIKERGQ